MTLISHPSAAAPLGSKNMLRLGAARLGRAIAARTPPPPAPREAHGYRAARSSGDQGDRSGEGDAASDPAAPSQLQPAAPDFRGFGRQQQEQLRQKISTAEALRESLGGEPRRHVLPACRPHPPPPPRNARTPRPPPNLHPCAPLSPPQASAAPPAASPAPPTSS